MKLRPAGPLHLFKLDAQHKSWLAATAVGQHPVPFRTRKLSLPAIWTVLYSERVRELQDAASLFRNTYYCDIRSYVGALVV